jgi:hypothetical protein
MLAALAKAWVGVGRSVGDLGRNKTDCICNPLPGNSEDSNRISPGNLQAIIILLTLPYGHVTIGSRYDESLTEYQEKLQ